MKSKNFLLLITISTFLLSSCSTKTEETEVSETPASEKVVADKCIYLYDNGSTGIYWTAYKHSAKVAVQGIFDSIEVTGADESENMLDLLTNTSFVIYSSGIDSKDLIRDEKIRNFFFGNMINGETISGEITSVIGDESDGDGTINLKMNDLEKEVPFIYEIQGEIVKIRCSLDFNNWNCTKSLDELHKACEEKHTGEDGKSIFWPVVDVLIETTLQIECN